MNIMASRFQKDYLWRFHFKAVCFDFICLACNNMWCISDFRLWGKSIRIRWLGICPHAINRISMVSTCHSGDIAGYNGIVEGMTYSLFSNHHCALIDFHETQLFRYVPKDSPREQVFRVTGVQVCIYSKKRIIDLQTCGQFISGWILAKTINLSIA